MARQNESCGGRHHLPQCTFTETFSTSLKDEGIESVINTGNIGYHTTLCELTIQSVDYQ